MTISEEVLKEEAKIQVGKGEMIQRSKGKEKMTTSLGFHILIEVDEELQPIEGKKDTQHQLNLTSEHAEAKVDAPYDPAVYGSNQGGEREELWETLIGLSGTVDGSWVVIGDFNNVMQREERLGGHGVSLTEIQGMRRCIEECEMQDIKQIVEKGWKQEDGRVKMYQVVWKLKRLKADLKQLNRTKFADIQIKADQLREQLQQLPEELSHRPQDEVLQAKEKEMY
ncbi:OLC1v1024154C1 [Oldenlandia corymbosa var. corymbosa]|uniref:OLC1v1024154C1 n=1 Tax=Oldenlandia corymbosa var. corymbosa TaxID=529605 RepID=A0AAV1C4P8_OLDCO|nr:OLC1v1024154C1 [Oldenlandia corymbosa var. corymbosa]